MLKKSLIAISLMGAMSGAAFASGNGHAHWGYEGHEGPANWGDISKDFSLCSAGKQQSPIDITGAHKMGASPIEFHYGEAKDPEVVNNGHTIQVNYPAGSYAMIGGKKYNLLQFHFHSPSEHTINGKHADFVAHLVHKADDGELAVVGVLFNKGGENATLKPVLSSAPQKSGKANVKGTINVASLLPSDQSYYHYSGSLTTPPCSEGVNWNVMANMSSISDAQVKTFTKTFPKSIRPVQALNDRMVNQQ